MSSLFYGTSFQTNQASTKTFSMFPTTHHCRKVVKVQRAATMGNQYEHNYANAKLEVKNKYYSQIFPIIIYIGPLLVHDNWPKKKVVLY